MNQPREYNDLHLALIRQCPCLSCGRPQAGEAAHLRISGNGKAITGIARKPDDRWSNPLCHECHMKQHSDGERNFWKRLNIDPFVSARRLFEFSPNLNAMREYAWHLIEGG